MRFARDLGSGWEIRVGRVEALLWLAISLALSYCTYMLGISVGRSSHDQVPTTATITLEGTIKSIKHRNERTGFAVMLLSTTPPSEPLTIVGKLPQVRPGLRVRVDGSYVQHPKFGRQFSVTTMSLDYRSEAELSGEPAAQGEQEGAAILHAPGMVPDKPEGAALPPMEN